MSGPPIGARIARQRRRRGLSQAELAGLCGVSTSWLSQVERGRRGVPKYETLVQLAEVLHCGISDLTGAAEPDQDVRGFTPASAVRRTLDAHDLVPLLLSGGEQQPVAEPWLRSRLARVQGLYQAARYEEAGDLLPEVLASARLLVHQVPSGNRRRAYALLSEAYIAVVTVMNRVGERETARLAVDRAIIAAEAADDPLSLTLATYRLGHVQLSAGAHAEAAGLTSSTAAAIAGRAAASPQWLSLWGALHLTAALGSARGHAHGEALFHLKVAEQAAAQLGSDRNELWTAFGPTNVRIHEVSTAAFLGQPTEVVRLAERLDVSSLPDGLNGRRVQVLIDLAHGYAEQRQDAAAVNTLLSAERRAPQVFLYQPAVHSMLRSLLAREHRASTPELRPLAERAGVV